jgi:signal transduction histidine kinase
VLTDRGLLEAIEARIARLPIGVAIRADPTLRGARFPPQVEDGAYFFVCEALANTLKDAAASGVVVRLARDGDHLVVKVEDDGAGFGNTHQPGTRPRCGMLTYRIVAASTAMTIGQRGSATGPVEPAARMSPPPRVDSLMG